MKRIVPGLFFPIAAILLVLAIIGPIFTVLVNVAPGEVVRAFSRPPASDALRVSLLASSAATAIASILGVPAGYWLARSSPRLAGPALFVLALPLALPPVASGIVILAVLGQASPLGAWLGSVGMNVSDTMAGVVASEFFVSGSFVAIASTAAFSALDPIYEDAARTLGAPEWRIFTRVALPAAAGNVAAGIAFTWLRAIGEYGATSIVAYHPASLPVALYIALSASGVRAALVLAYGFVALAVAVIGVQWFLRRRVVV
ncbi:MAG: ABC transporter permease subunit [Candidatus Eremiobacteraeota bacterium]|nr:ABC transporter permease subunit [Candidatus Eremiobacteraeota bacterium]